jgi:exonuclease SbcC
VRPIRLEMEGFGAFRDLTQVDFEGVDLFALVGPTGAGKSTVIDAMCFALYGSVPRYGHKGSVAPVVTMTAIEAKVSLTFEAAGKRYVATRVVRRGKTGASTKEARLEEMGGDVLAGAAGEMNAAVQAVLGLTFEHFTRAVVLPQNEFARFLHDTPGDRQDLIVSLLGYDVYARMMQRARSVAAEHEVEVNVALRRLEVLADCTSDQVDVHQQWVKEYAGLRKQVRAAGAALHKLEREAEAAKEDADRRREVVKRLQAVSIPAKFERLAEDRALAEAKLAESERAGVAAGAEVAKSQAALEQLGSRDPLVAARAAYAELDQVRAKLAAAVTRVEKADAALGPAVEALTEAEATLEALRVAHAAHDLVGALAVGEPCPVCDQPVARVPKRKAPARGTDARKRLEQAKVAEREAREAAAQAKQSVAELEGRVQALTKQVAEHPDPTALEQRLAALDVAAEAVTKAQRAEAATRREEADARRGLATADDSLKQAATKFRAQRDALVQARVEPPTEQGALASDWPALVAWAAGEVPAHVEAAGAADARAVAVLQERDERLGALITRAAELEVEVRPRAGTDDLAEALVRAEEASKADLERVKAGIKERAQLEQDVQRLGSEVQVAKELARLLDAKHFERWLAVEALELLVAGASERLLELSTGQYSLASDETSRDLLVLDHRNANERRSVRTLSGGETFQASLALALALADQLADLAADGAARLESIFLDEGFGALDADTLETVAGTLESLGAGDRMVGVVTHVRELAERMPVQYRVTKGPLSATVEQVSR